METEKKRKSPSDENVGEDKIQDISNNHSWYLGNQIKLLVNKREQYLTKCGYEKNDNKSEASISTGRYQAVISQTL